VALVAALLVVPVTLPTVASASGSKTWVDAWATSFTSTAVNGVAVPVTTLDDQTYRLEATAHVGGTRVRVQLTNRFGATALHVAAARVGLQADANSIRGGSDRALRFAGRPAVTLEPGDEVWSDPVTLGVRPAAVVSVSIYVPGPYAPTTGHDWGLHTSYLSTTGNHTAAATLPLAADHARTTQVLMVSAVQVWAPAMTQVVVAFGDSITDGVCSTIDGDDDWPDALSRRLAAVRAGPRVSVVNLGISANRVVSSDAVGPSGVHRFVADVLARPNVRAVIVLEGINDITHEHASAAEITGAYATLVAQAHAAGVRIYGATLLPIGSSGVFSEANEATREAVNDWIGAPGHFDAVIDFERAVREPGSDPPRMPRRLTCDFLHPDAAGYAAMARAIPLRLFR
jgi:lysophospholipase L1-like esterase